MLGPELLTGAAMQRILSALVLLAITLPLTGCSLIGLAIGSASDSNAPEQITRFKRMDQLSGGTPLTLITTHGDTVKEDLVGLREIHDYEKIYRDRVSGTLLGDVVPAPQAQVTVVSHEKATLLGTRQHRFQAKVRGFDPGVVHLLPVQSRYSPILSFSDLDSLLSDGGHSIDAATLVRMCEGQGVPFISELGIRDTLETRWIPTDEISVISAEPSHSGAMTGFLIGASVDACVVIVGIVSWYNTPLFSGKWKL